MGPRLRKLALTVHVMSSVGWIGGVAAYMTLDVAVATSQDAQTIRAAYLMMDLMTAQAIIPLAFAALITGLVMSLGTKWGLFRHYWVIVSLVLTIFALLILLVETRTISFYAEKAADPATSPEELGTLGSTLLHSVGGTVVLLVVMVLNMYKPRGLTRYGWRKLQAERIETGKGGATDDA